MLILREVPRPGVRLSAGLASAETTTALALAHTAAGSELPTPGWLLAVAATAYGASLLVLRGRAPVRVVLPALVGLQVLLHAWLVALTAGSDLHRHGTGSDALLGLTWPMLVTHVAAGFVAAVAWVLRRRAVDVLLGWVDGSLPAVAFRRCRGGEWSTPAPPGRDLVTRPSRGPPRALLAAV